MEYKPLQLNLNVNYQESHPQPELQPIVACFWQLQTLKPGGGYHVIPDGCVDIVFNCQVPDQLFLSPTAVAPEVFPLQPHDLWFGIRLFPGVAASILQISIDELQLETILLENIQYSWSRELRQRLVEAQTFEERIQVAGNFLLARIRKKTLAGDGRFHKMLKEIYRVQGNISLTNERELPTSSRHLRRIFRQYTGLSPKRFSRIVRAQHYLHCLQQGKEAAAFYDHYYDQAHMIKEVKSLTGYTPGQISRLIQE